MKALCDTNLLLRSYNKADPSHAVARQAVNHLIAAGEELVLVPQNLYEFWAVLTRPVKQNGYDLPPAAAAAELATLRASFTVLDDAPGILAEWERLVITHSVLGKSAHDAHLAAAMLVHGITHILTFNDRHFTRFPLTVLTPAGVVAASPGPP